MLVCSSKGQILAGNWLSPKNSLAWPQGHAVFCSYNRNLRAQKQMRYVVNQF